MKKLIFLTSLALFACWSSKAQSGNHESRTRYGIYAQLGHSRYVDGVFYSRVGWEQTRNLYSIGLSLRHRLSKRWTLSSGIGLNYKKYDVMGAQLQDPSHPAYNPADELGWNCMPVRQTVLYAYNTQLGVEIPVLMQYHIVKDRFFVSSGIEINAGMYVKYNAAHQAYDQSITKIEKAQAVSAYQLMLPLGCGMTIPAGKHLLGIEPGIKLLLADYQSPDYFFGLFTLRTSFYF